jgi:hypothetical protein
MAEEVYGDIEGKGLCTDAWGLVYKCFKEGEEVIFIDNDDFLYFGKLIYLKGQELKYMFMLRKKDGTTTKFLWSDVRFMAHDGFPIRRLAGADGSKLAEQIDTTDIQHAIREIAEYTICFECKTKIKKEDVVIKRYNKYCSSCAKTIVFNDPYMIEGVNITLFNKGNEGIAFTNHPDEECLLLIAKDNAKAILYETSTIFHLS